MAFSGTSWATNVIAIDISVVPTSTNIPYVFNYEYNLVNTNVINFVLGASEVFIGQTIQNTSPNYLGIWAID